VLPVCTTDPAARALECGPATTSNHPLLLSPVAASLPDTTGSHLGAQHLDTLHVYLESTGAVPAPGGALRGGKDATNTTWIIRNYSTEGDGHVTAHYKGFPNNLGRVAGCKWVPGHITTLPAKSRVVHLDDYRPEPKHIA
jgi:hypothetical protein